MQDPKIAQLVGQNPQAQALQSAMLAHINEHLAYEYRKQMEQQMGIDLPFHPDDDDAQGIPAEMEVRVSQLAAQAAQVLLQRNQTEIAAQQAQQAAQDPIIQMQQQEMAIKQKEADIKEKQFQVEAAAKADQLSIERERIASQERIAGLNAGIKVEGEKMQLSAKQQLEGARMGIDVAKAKDQLNAQRQQRQQPNFKGEK
jgi:hypothetical protein